MAQVINVSLNNVLESIASTYSKFINRYVVATFRFADNAELLMINNSPEANIFEFPADQNIIIPNTNDPLDISFPMFNWPYFQYYNNSNLDPYGNLFWKIPVNGISKHLGKFIYNTYTYYNIFGQFNSVGDIIQTTPLSKQLDLTFNVLSDTNVYLVEFKIEAMPSPSDIVTIPCDTVVTYYNDDGNLTIPIT
jgi:hypothetical protein